MNSKLIILTLAILGIQLINASILKDENLILETSNVSLRNLPFFTNEITETIADKKTKTFKDTSSLSFSKSKILKEGDVKQPQLFCTKLGPDGKPTDELKDLCNKYGASNAVCKNLNHKKEDAPKFECKLSGMKYTNKNLDLLNFSVISCKGMTEKNPFEYELPAKCQLAYTPSKNGDFDEKDDVKAKGSKGGMSTGWIVVIVIIVIGLVGGAGFFVYTKTRA